MALLMKLEWRLAVNPQGLAHQVLRAKYFSKADFFTSPIGSNPSFTWRSIVAARPMLMCGLRWEVGDGIRIRVLGDPWLPRPSTFRIISNPKSLSPTTSVLALLDDDRKWKEDLIMGEFERRHILYYTNYTKKCS
ncbi:UNVERIFIED_CONTAM: hypothetical protein Sangu_2960100 [Sesamum angustifolium]|uniref:Uncharacterized protein n=1 Tax=Sesamum angustifolium TaxID=2727405 RepID=A0AAW2IJA2_9LAMI